MATPAQLLPNVPSIIRFRLSRSLQALIAEKLERRGLSVEKYFLELIFADIAPRRLEIWRAKLPPPPKPAEKKIENIPTGERKARYRAEESQRILALHDEGIPPRAIAVRLSCSAMKVHRVIANYEHSKHVERPTSAAHQRGNERFWER